MTKLADEMNMSPPPLRKKMKPKLAGSDDIIVTPPPPGKRNIRPGRRANMPSIVTIQKDDQPCMARAIGVS